MSQPHSIERLSTPTHAERREYALRIARLTLRYEGLIEPDVEEMLGFYGIRTVDDIETAELDPVPESF